jgi:hypothetical protein
MKRIGKRSVAIFVLPTFLVVIHNASAALVAVEYSSTIDTLNEEATFSIEFNRAPDFFTLDGFGRQADSFQYYIDVDATVGTVGEIRFIAGIIVRGGEIHLEGDIRVRDREGDGGVNSGGWGPIRGSVPFQLTGNILTFTSPWTLINDDGVFSYALLLTEYGGLTDFVFGLSGESYPAVPPPPPPPPVPIPGAVWLFGSALGLLAWMRRKAA